MLFIEAGAADGAAGLTLTGQLGDVMKESAQIALSFVRSHAAELGVDPAVLDRAIHVHVPAGAVPKDGPSAGITMVTALTSLATGRPVRSEVGMTGEVTLNGRVLPIGGLKQKLLAAQRAGLTEVFVPAAQRARPRRRPRRRARRRSPCTSSATSSTWSAVRSPRPRRSLRLLDVAYPRTRWLFFPPGIDRIVRGYPSRGARSETTPVQHADAMCTC